jgi:membrane-associated PAP2 superfamily phosphatase
LRQKAIPASLAERDQRQRTFFPSGHSSAAFYMIAPYFIYRKKNAARLISGWPEA